MKQEIPACSLRFSRPQLIDNQGVSRYNNQHSHESLIPVTTRRNYMKYLLIIVACIALTSAGLTGYLYLNPGFLVDSPRNNPTAISPGALSGEMQELNARIKQLQGELSNLKIAINQQANDMAQLTANNSRIDDFYKKLKEIQASLPGAGKAGVSDIQTAPELQASASGPVTGSFSPELFQNPEFAKLFVGQVEEAIKQIEEKQRAEQAKRIAEQIQKRIAQRIEEFAKAQSINDYQKQELSKILVDRITKSQELFTQMRLGSDPDQSPSPEQMRVQMETLRTESNEKVKQILLPNQYEEYQKIENSLTGGRGMGRGPGGRENQPAPAPSQGQGTTPQGR